MYKKSVFTFKYTKFVLSALLYFYFLFMYVPAVFVMSPTCLVTATITNIDILMWIITDKQQVSNRKYFTYL